MLPLCFLPTSRRHLLFFFPDKQSPTHTLSASLQRTGALFQFFLCVLQRASISGGELTCDPFLWLPPRGHLAPAAVGAGSPPNPRGWKSRRDGSLQIATPSVLHRQRRKHTPGLSGTEAYLRVLQLRPERQA